MSARSSQPHVAVTGRRTDGRRPAPPATEIVPTATRRNRRRLFPPISFVSFLEFWTGAKAKRRGTIAAWRLAWCQNRSAVEQPPLCLAPVCLSRSRSLPNLTHSFHPGVVQSFQPGQRSLQTRPRFRAQPLQQSLPLPCPRTCPVCVLSGYYQLLCPAAEERRNLLSGGREIVILLRKIGSLPSNLVRGQSSSSSSSSPRRPLEQLLKKFYSARLSLSFAPPWWTGLASTTNSAQDSERVCAFLCGNES